MVRELRLTAHEKKKYHLDDTKKINSVVQKYDMIIPVVAKASEMSYNRAEVETLREMWESYNGVYFEQGIIDKMFSLIKELSPEYYNSACEYFSQSIQLLHNEKRTVCPYVRVPVSYNEQDNGNHRLQNL